MSDANTDEFSGKLRKLFETIDTANLLTEPLTSSIKNFLEISAADINSVLEYINRRGDPPFEPFTPAEMDKAAIFAEAMASLVSAYESAKLLHSLGDKIVSGNGEADLGPLRSWLADLRDSREHREMMDLAILVREISLRGDAERKMCREI